MIVSDNTIKAQGLGDFKILGKKMAKNVISNRTRALDITANIATAAATRDPSYVMKTLPELITFYNTGKGLYLGKFVKIMLYEWKQKQKHYIPQHHLKIFILNKD